MTPPAPITWSSCTGRSNSNVGVAGPESPTASKLGKRRRELERELASIDRDLMPLCPMNRRAGELQERRRVVRRELDDVLRRQAQLRGDCPRPRASVWNRQR